MSKKNEMVNQEVQVQEVAVQDITEAQEKEPAIRKYAINAMRTAIINQSLNGVNHAITKDEAAASGCCEEKFADWKNYVDNLREACISYIDLTTKPEDKKNLKEVKAAEDYVWRCWRAILKCGEEDVFHPNMFVRRTDVGVLTTYAGHITYVYVPGKGRQAAITGQNNFRKMVEFFLAARISGNAILKDLDRETLTKYQGALKTIQKMTDRLDGYTDKDGGKVTGLRQQKKDAEGTLEAVTATLKAAKMTDEQIQELTKVHENLVKSLAEQVKQAEKSLSSAEKKRDELKKDYDEITAKLDALETPKEVSADEKKESPYAVVAK